MEWHRGEETLPDVSGVCIVRCSCQRQYAQYVCPRCNALYCSLHCYKAHSQQCTETFYRENLLAEMRVHDTATTDGRKKIVEILQRVAATDKEIENDDDDDDDDGDDDETTIAVLTELSDLVLQDRPVSPSQLPPKLRRRFMRAAASGQLTNMMKMWTPWWDPPSTESTRRVVLEEDSVVPSTLKNEGRPSLRDPPPPLATLTKQTPSPLLKFNVLDVLYAYAFALRVYNGDWAGEPVGAAGIVLCVSPVLSRNAVYHSVPEAIHAVVEASMQPSARRTAQFSVAIVHDVALLLTRRDWVEAALCDLMTLLEAGRQEAKRTRKLDHAARKVAFMRAWFCEAPYSVSLLSLHASVLQQWEEMMHTHAEGPVQAPHSQQEGIGVMKQTHVHT